MPRELEDIYDPRIPVKSHLISNVTQVSGLCNKGDYEDSWGIGYIFKRVREQYLLLPHRLYLNDRIHWADLHTGPTLSAFILLYDIFLLAFLDGVCGAFLSTGSARHALIIDLIRHCSHLLTIIFPLFPSLLPQSPHLFFRRRYPLSFVPDSASDVIHPRKYPSPFPLSSALR